MFVEYKNATARKEGGNYFEARVLRRRTDERQLSAFDEWQKVVLLSLVKTMDLVNEEDGQAGKEGSLIFHLSDDLFDLFNAGCDGAKREKGRLRALRNKTGDCRFACTWRAPEDEGGGIATFSSHAKRFSGADEVILANDLVKGVGTHPIG